MPRSQRNVMITWFAFCRRNVFRDSAPINCIGFAAIQTSNLVRSFIRACRIRVLRFQRNGVSAGLAFCNCHVWRYFFRVDCIWFFAVWTCDLHRSHRLNWSKMFEMPKLGTRTYNKVTAIALNPTRTSRNWILIRRRRKDLWYRSPRRRRYNPYEPEASLCLFYLNP